MQKTTTPYLQAIQDQTNVYKQVVTFEVLHIGKDSFGQPS